MNRLTAFGLAAVALALAACSALPGGRPSPTPTPTSPPTASAGAPTNAPTPSNPPQTSMPTSLSELDGRQFVSVLLEDPSHQLVNGSRVRLSFKDGQISASAGCNSMGGAYRVDGARLVVDAMYQTEMACQEKLMEQDAWLASFLGSKPTIELSGSDLTLTTDDAKLSLLDREIAEPDQPLTMITWGLSTIVTGDVASSIPDGIVATLLLGDDGGVQLNDGCNSGGGSYVVDGNAIKFSDLVVTQRACGGDAGRVSAAVNKVLLAKSITFAIDAATLTLQAGDDALLFSAAVDVSD